MPRKNNRTDRPADDIRRKAWKHNSFFGHTRMIHSQCEAMVHAPSTTPEAKAVALRIINEVKELTKLLKVRVDK